MIKNIFDQKLQITQVSGLNNSNVFRYLYLCLLRLLKYLVAYKIRFICSDFFKKKFEIFVSLRIFSGKIYLLKILSLSTFENLTQSNKILFPTAPLDTEIFI